MKNENEPEKVVASIRYSSHNQDDGNSVSAQMMCIEKYCAEHNMVIENCYIDTAKTGRNTNRPQYQQMLKDLADGTVQAKTVIVRAIDRLHRNAKNQLQDLDWFEKNGIRFIAVHDGIDTFGNTSIHSLAFVCCQPSYEGDLKCLLYLFILY